MKVILCCFILYLSNSAKSQFVDFALTNIENKNFGKAQKNIKQISKKNELKNLAKAYYFKSIQVYDSSLYYLNHLDFDIIFQSDINSRILNRHFLDSVRLLYFRQELQERVFEQICQVPTPLRINNFIAENSDFKYIQKAELLRDELALNEALENGNSMFIREFLDSFPNSKLTPKAEKIFCLKQYQENTPNNTEKEVFDFIFNYPKNCLIDSAKNVLIEKCYKSKNIEILLKFIEKESNEEVVLKSWKTIYNLEVDIFESNKLKRFIELYPKYPFEKELKNDIKLLESEMFPGTIDGKMVFFSKNGDLLIANQYDEVNLFSNNLSIVGIGEKFGCIDKKGNLVIPIQYDLIYNFGKFNTIIEKNELYGIIDRNNNLLLKADFEDIVRIDDFLFAVKKNDYYVLCNVKEPKIFSGQFDDLEEKWNGITLFKDGLQNIPIQRDSFLFSTWYENIISIEKKSFLLFDGESCSLVNVNGELLFNSICDKIKLLDQASGLFSIQDKNEIRIIDKLGKEKLKFNTKNGYSMDFFQSNSGLLSVYKKGKFGAMNLNGKSIIDSNFDQIVLCDSNVLARENQTWSLFDFLGNKILEKSDGKINWLTKELFSVKRNLEFFVYDSKAKKIISVGYDNIKSIGENVLLIEKNNKLGLMKLNGELIVEEVYSKIIPMDNEIYAMYNGIEIEYYDGLNDKIIAIKK